MEKRRQTLRKRSAQAAAAADQGGHRRWLAVGCSVAAAALVIGGIVIIRSRGSSAADVTMVAAQVDGTVGPLDITESPAAYTVTYRVETFASDGGSALTTEDFSILRPFDTSIVSKSGAPPGGDEQWSVTTTTGLYQQSSAGQDPTANVFAPTTAPGDYRFDASLGDLVADGDFVMGERRTLLGRQCQVYRTGSPLESYTITAPTDTDHSDVCIDDAGLLLEE
ncbi:MAG: hypothetical protein JWN99_2797, partial [Ilumatobacteraceae bacterium]|nr:hypothetical protein [Ilumatobacteraceae bacterium]